jgi:hypothetical protein
MLVHCNEFKTHEQFVVVMVIRGVVVAMVICGVGWDASICALAWSIASAARWRCASSTRTALACAFETST